MKKIIIEAAAIATVTTAISMGVYPLQLL